MLLEKIKKVSSHFTFGDGSISFQVEGVCFLGQVLGAKTIRQDNEPSEAQIKIALSEKISGGSPVTHYGIELSDNLETWLFSSHPCCKC